MARKKASPKDGKYRLMALETLKGDPPPPGVQVECGCPCTHRVAPGREKRRCFVCGEWRKPVWRA